MQYPLSSFFLRLCVARRSKAAHISRSSPHQVLGNSHEKRLDVDEVLYQHYVKKLLVGYLEDRILAEAGRLGPRLGLGRRDFLRTSGGMATALLAMNAVFGRFFDVAEIEAAEPAAFR